MRQLETERLLLREFRPEDHAGVSQWESGFHADKFLEFCLRSYREWGMGPWALVSKQSGVIAGNCGFCRIRYDRAAGALEYCGEVNYYIAPRHRRQGVASEALRAVVKFGFGELRLTRIEGRCALENRGSERVMQNAGLRFESMAAAAEAGSPDEKLYAILREHSSG